MVKMKIFTDGPQFRHQPISVETQYGATEILQCDVDGNPTPEIRWYHEDSERQVASTPNISVVVNHETAGRYFCKAHVPGFQELMGYANIYIRAPPSIVSQRVQYVPDEGAVKVIISFQDLSFQDFYFPLTTSPCSPLLFSAIVSVIGIIGRNASAFKSRCRSKTRRHFSTRRDDLHGS